MATCKLPPGFRFMPNDEELIIHLRNKNMHLTMPPIKIEEVRVYDMDPENLTKAHKSNGAKEWYFFTVPNKKYSSGTRANRIAGDGYWKAVSIEKKIFQGDKRIGSRRGLEYFKGLPPNAVRTTWKMHEYTLADHEPSSSTRTKVDNWVLCKIYNKGYASRNKENQYIVEEANDDQMEIVANSTSELQEFIQSLQQGLLGDATEGLRTNGTAQSMQHMSSLPPLSPPSQMEITANDKSQENPKISRGNSDVVEFTELQEYVQSLEQDLLGDDTEGFKMNGTTQTMQHMSSLPPPPSQMEITANDKSQENPQISWPNTDAAEFSELQEYLQSLEQDLLGDDTGCHDPSSMPVLMPQMQITSPNLQGEIPEVSMTSFQQFMSSLQPPPSQMEITSPNLLGAQSFQHLSSLQPPPSQMGISANNESQEYHRIPWANSYEAQLWDIVDSNEFWTNLLDQPSSYDFSEEAKYLREETD